MRSFGYVFGVLLFVLAMLILFVQSDGGAVLTPVRHEPATAPYVATPAGNPAATVDALFDSEPVDGEPIDDSEITQLSPFARCKFEAVAGGFQCIDQNPFKDWPIEAIEAEAYGNPIFAAAAASHYMAHRDRTSALKWAFRAAALDAKHPDALVHLASHGLFSGTSVEVPGEPIRYFVDVLEDRYVVDNVLYYLDRATQDDITRAREELARIDYEEFSALDDRVKDTLKEMASIEIEITGQSFINRQIGN